MADGRDECEGVAAAGVAYRQAYVGRGDCHGGCEVPCAGYAVHVFFDAYACGAALQKAAGVVGDEAGGRPGGNRFRGRRIRRSHRNRLFPT